MATSNAPVDRDASSLELQESEDADQGKTEGLQSMEGEKQAEGTFSLVVKNFSAVWWTVAMDTGVLSIILHQFPYPSHWTKICSTIMFVLLLVLSIIFGTITLLRWLWFRQTFVAELHADSEDIALQACPAIAWMTITIQVQLTCAPAWGVGFTVLAYVMWWIGLIWVGSICVVLYLHLIKVPSRSIVDRWLATAVFIPIVGSLTVANAAGLIVNNAVEGTHFLDRLAVPTIIIGFVVVGFALSLGFVMYSIYTHRLMTSGLPPSLKIPGMILTIGPCGQSASALLQLGSAAVNNDNFAKYARGFFLQEDAASVIRIMCVVMALLLLGFAIWWICLDYYAIISGLIRREIHPSLFWWSSIFPVGTVVTALAGLGTDMDSPAFRVLAVILFTFLFCVYIVNTIFTIPMTLSGELLGLPKTSGWGFKGVKHRHPWSGSPRRLSETQ